MTTSPSTSTDEVCLDKLRPYLSTQNFDWIKRDDEERNRLKQQIADECPGGHLFADAEDEDEPPRVQEWTSSRSNVDGHGGYDQRKKDGSPVSEEDDGDTVTVVFLLSESYEGFGDTLWASSRYAANVLADPKKCKEILSPMLLSRGVDETLHPLNGVTFLELGAGAALPSAVAIYRGARVVSSDLRSANRIRCMAESIYRNVARMKELDVPLYHAEEARSCPLNWEKTPDEVKDALGVDSFDVIVAADCCYMPWLHFELLSTVESCLSRDGVALIPFCLHGNTEDSEVRGIVDKAKEMGFKVEELPDTQLTPPTLKMDYKQGLVHTLRLTKTD